ncbi:MAG TPA: hypothetical protein VFB14_03980 [Bryobacteraceae bacterium]|jgi:hypothetical protein|nr:hypothetical protein [Bryobacteraceae bacterium]
MEILDWLLNSDPAIRWQAMRDLTDASPAVLQMERKRVAGEGIGAEILAHQQPDGAWRRDNAPAWLTTLFTLQLLRATGINSADPIVEAAAARLEAGLRWNDQGGSWELRPVETGGNTFFQGEVEPCINGGVLAVGSYFGRPVEMLAERLVAEQLEDGGWNCEAPKTTRSSFHTTICVLEGLLEYERAVGSAPQVAAARLRGEEYLLKRTLFRRLSTGEIVHPNFLQFAFPPRYHYDVLRALDYFRNTGTEANRCMLDAVQIIRQKQQADGRWLLDHAYDEALAVSFGDVAGAPSRWNTLRALRVLRWFGQ